MELEPVDHDPFASGFEPVEHDPFGSEFGHPAPKLMPPTTMSTPPEWAQGFDEHKVFLGFGTQKQVRRVYAAAFSDGRSRERLGHLAAMPVDAFKQWLARGNTMKPIETHRAAA